MKGYVIGASTVISLACILSIPGSWAESFSAQSRETSPEVVKGSKVTVQYVILAPDLTPIDYGMVREFIQGRHEVLPAVEQEVDGMKLGEEKQVVLGPEEGFGPHDDRKKVNVPKSVLPFGAKEGDVLENDHGDLATVSEVSETRAVLDYNHPLAGKPVVVQLKILKVEHP
ncbi:MAG: FKBP-type peptidyl-prolyl cis-trans isomerase [Nitrospiraceae bacterium]